MVVMSEELDLSFLTPDETAQLKSVLERAQLLENEHERQRKEGANEISSDDVIRSRWKEKHQEESDTYQPAITILTAALKDESGSGFEHSGSDSEENHPLQVSDEVDVKSTLSDLASSVHQEDPTTKSSVFNGLSSLISVLSPSPTYDKSESKPPEVHVTEAHTLGNIPETEANHKSALDDPEIISLGSSMLSDEVNEPETAANKEERGQPSPLPVDKAPESPSKEHSPTNSENETSMLSRSTHANEFVGEIDIRLTYYPPSCGKHTTFPSKGTRFAENTKLDVLTRKHYVVMTGSKLQIAKDSKTGATKENDGELHLTVKGASDLNLPNVMRQKARTYAKCYLLPDRYHGSKMRSEVIKDTLQPRYEHKFIFRGFSETEFQERSIELVIGGITSHRGRHIVVGGVRLSNGEHSKSGLQLPWKDSTVEEIKIWKKAFTEPTVEASTTIPLQAHIKLTYK